MESHFFSVIIPVRSINKYLTSETLPAINKQTYKKFEVIILPNSQKDFDSLKKKYSWLTIIKSQSMPGIKRDLGVKKAKGDIVVFIDDDAFPPVHWLKTLNNMYKKKNDVVAVGGPGILPENGNLWEKIFDTVLQSFIGSGGFSYRFIKGKEQFVNDFPSMNLSLKKKIFLKLGGFKNKYWPGEDSKLINALINREKKQILYNPDTFIYHHRRDNLVGYLQQHKNYGFMRGMFFAHGDKNSRGFTYVIPSLFIIYISISTLMFIISNDILLNQKQFTLLFLPLLVYSLMIGFLGILTFIKTLNIPITIGTMIVLPLTHIVYGIYFILGFAKGIVR